MTKPATQMTKYDSNGTLDGIVRTAVAYRVYHQAGQMESPTRQQLFQVAFRLRLSIRDEIKQTA